MWPPGTTTATRKQGDSFEHANFFDCLHHMGEDILYFDFPGLLRQHGQGGMNRRLRDVRPRRKARPDVYISGAGRTG